jgi:hypothetical protein
LSGWYESALTNMTYMFNNFNGNIDLSELRFRLDGIEI